MHMFHGNDRIAAPGNAGPGHDPQAAPGLYMEGCRVIAREDRAEHSPRRKALPGPEDDAVHGAPIQGRVIAVRADGGAGSSRDGRGQKGKGFLKFQ
jgi:hypothetical protein